MKVVKKTITGISFFLLLVLSAAIIGANRVHAESADAQVGIVIDADDIPQVTESVERGTGSAGRTGVKTGDNARLGGYIGVLTLSAAVIVLILLAVRRKEESENRS